MKISILIPSIRPDNWQKVYESVLKSTEKTFEIIFVGPECNTDIFKYANVKYCRDFGNPTRCQQIALTLAEGEMVCHFADDCVFVPGALDKAINLLEEKSKQNNKLYNQVVVTKYTEGNDILQSDDYYRLVYAYPASKNIDYNWVIFNSAIMWRKYITGIGGWDSQFEVPCVSHADLAVRCQRAGAKIYFMKESLCSCTHFPNRTMDHGPIHDAQEQHDAPLYKKIHDVENDRCFIPLDNWKNQPSIWERRFNV